MVDPLDDAKLKFAIVLPCTLEATVLPTERLIPRKRFATVLGPIVHALPPALAAPPPMKLFVIKKLLPDVFEIAIPASVAEAVELRVAVWYRLLPVIVQSVLPDDRRIPFSALDALKKLKMLLLEIVFPLLFVAVVVVVPLE